MSEEEMNQKEYMKAHRQSDAGRRSNVKAKWKFRGVKGDLDQLYDRYVLATHCDRCKRRFGTKGDGSDRFKVMHHSHATGYFHSFRCNRCNRNA